MGRRLRNILIPVLTVVVVAACSSTPERIYSAQPDRIIYQGNDKARLSHHFQSWAGTPHQMGGLSRRGIDCSGFVYVTFRDVYGMQLPRSTDQLWQVGEEIPLSDVRTGDLLFFKTGFKQQHVGIYLGDGQFIHASSSSGVMASNVRSPYWSDAYRETRRVPLP